jgi:hypothetical protein
MKLTDIKTIYICPDHNEKYHERKLHMDNLLTNLGFTNFHHYKSSTDSYPKCLCDATIDILKNNLDEPILILEDDIEYTGYSDISFDSSIDALYIGLSKSGGHPIINLHDGPSLFANYSNSQVRVINMLGGHAIIYISRKYKEAIIDSLERMGNTYYNDVLFSRLQKHYIILANKIPSFYQSAKFGNVQHVENWTKFQIN